MLMGGIFTGQPWSLGCRLRDTDENKTLEFKSVSSANPVDRILDILPPYISGFYNSTNIDGYHFMLFGTDDLARIIGVRLSDKYARSLCSLYLLLGTETGLYSVLIL